MTLTQTYQAMIADDRLRADPAQAGAVELLEKVAEALQAQPPVKKGLFSRFSSDADPVKGLYIWGGVGRGKSMLMDLFYEQAPEPRKRRVHFHAFMQDIHTALHAARKTGVDDAILPVAKEIIETTRLLCFDEMQISDITDAMIVGRLFEQLFDAGIVVVSTSNRVPDDLYKNGLNRDLFVPFIALVKDRMEIHELASPNDYRQDRLAGEQVYFSPANSEARSKMNDIWEAIAGGGDAPMVFTVKGREVHLPRFHNAAARASFFDLCGKFLGAADYLELARLVRVLMLDDIPRLSRSNFNEAKRFVTLIDALYEGRVRLICSAADVPERLYMEGEGAFEFERTASRLREMQSDGWGAS